jgi:3-oxoacyl-[acyl-carrier protein] reductase
MKRIVIVGASSGIGEALAQRLLNDQHRIVSIGRRQPNVAVEQHCTYDVTGTEAPPSLEGPIDGLVYCPGSINLRPFKALKPTDFLNDFTVSLLGAATLLQQYLPNLSASGKASVVLFSTVAVQTGMPYHASVAAAKGAVEGLARSLAAELAPKVRVNAIAPSLVKTPLAARLTDTEAKVAAAAERHPLKRIGEASELAALAAFLLSDEAGWITGQVLHVDGGMSSLKG